MNIFYLLIGVSLFGALVFLVLFIWAVKDKQFDDDKTPPIRMLFDDEPAEEKENDTTEVK
ncbi:MAG TPA: cbb3-type cytochrome oxidase assembly protein CcoS [Bacteroidales bacterium]|jgi:cbb3-type cytochrome oxidase maturation protein|nr:cbb3-type cytochrome oxidase assembly protein CcoS [Bacteroidales bacterium]